MVFVTKYSPGSVPPAPWASDPSPGVLDSATQWPFQLISDLTAKLVGADFTFDAQIDPTNGTSTGFRILRESRITPLPSMEPQLSDDQIAGDDTFNGGAGRDDLSSGQGVYERANVRGIR